MSCQLKNVQETVFALQTYQMILCIIIGVFIFIFTFVQEPLLTAVKDPSFIVYNTLITLSLLIYNYQTSMYMLLILVYCITYFPTALQLCRKDVPHAHNITGKIMLFGGQVFVVLLPLINMSYSHKSTISTVANFSREVFLRNYKETETRTKFVIEFNKFMKSYQCCGVFDNSEFFLENDTMLTYTPSLCSIQAMYTEGCYANLFKAASKPSNVHVSFVVTALVILTINSLLGYIRIDFYMKWRLRDVIEAITSSMSSLEMSNFGDRSPSLNSVVCETA